MSTDLDLMKMGVPLNDVIESNIKAYLKGFDDAIEYLKEVKNNVNIAEMKNLMIKKFQEANVVNDKF